MEAVIWNATPTAIIAFSLTVGAYLYFDKRRTDSFNEFVLRKWCSDLLRDLSLDRRDILPKIICYKRLPKAMELLRQLGATPRIVGDADGSASRANAKQTLVIRHLGKWHQLEIVDFM